jgi:hypothetical protein
MERKSRISVGPHDGQSILFGQLSLLSLRGAMLKLIIKKSVPRNLSNEN